MFPCRKLQKSRGEVSKISSKDQTLQHTREQNLDVPVQQMIEQLVDVLKIVIGNSISAGSGGV